MLRVVYADRIAVRYKVALETSLASEDDEGFADLDVLGRRLAHEKVAVAKCVSSD